MNDSERHFEIDLDARKRMVRRSIAWTFLGLIGLWPLYAYLYFLGDDPEIGIGTDLTCMWVFCLFSGALTGIMFAFARTIHYASKRNLVHKASIVDDEGIYLRFATETKLLQWNGVESIFFMGMNPGISKHIVVLSKEPTRYVNLFLEKPGKFLV